MRLFEIIISSMVEAAENARMETVFVVVRLMMLESSHSKDKTSLKTAGLFAVPTAVVGGMGACFGPVGLSCGLCMIFIALMYCWRVSMPLDGQG